MARKHKTSRPASSNSKSAIKHQVRKRIWVWLSVGLGIVVLLAAAFFMVQPKSAISAEISPAQAYEKFQQGAFFLDVRSAEEWARIHIAPSTLIPLDELQSRLGELPKDKDVVVVCLSGKRSKAGLAVLQQAGFERAFCMTGGIDAWKAAGYPVEGNAP